VGITTPLKQLRGFKKARNVAPGSAQKLEVSLDKYAFSLWDEVRHAWRVSVGRYEIHVGFSSEHLPLSTSIEIPETFYWSGL
jgi:beta-glucosidase